MKKWIKNPNQISDKLYSMRKNQTFALQYSRKGNTYTKYVIAKQSAYTDTKNYYDTSFAEPYDVVLDVQMKKNPSADFLGSKQISHDPEKNIVYLKTGVGRFVKIDKISEYPMKIEYSSNREMVAKCDQCGTETTVPIQEADTYKKGTNMIQTDEGMVTPCCRSSEWTTKMKEDSS